MNQSTYVSSGRRRRTRLRLAARIGFGVGAFLVVVVIAVGGLVALKSQASEGFGSLGQSSAAVSGDRVASQQSYGEGAEQEAGSLSGGAQAGGGEPGEGATEGLDGDLLGRFRAARSAAAADGIDLVVTSGWRSEAYQQQLLDEAVEKYGSRKEALKWVLPPNESAHVVGKAIDVGPGAAARTWLEEHGSAYGLCRVYMNETWHFEPTVDPGGQCPPLIPNARGN